MYLKTVCETIDQYVYEFKDLHEQTGAKPKTAIALSAHIVLKDFGN